MDIREYWSLPATGQGSQQEVLSELSKTFAPDMYGVRCGGIKVIDVGKAVDDINPCTALYGYGPDGAICRDCVHCRYPIRRNTAAKYWKCDLRKLTHGSATDHRVRWPACGRYEKRTEEYSGG